MQERQIVQQKEYKSLNMIQIFEHILFILVGEFQRKYQTNLFSIIDLVKIKYLYIKQKNE
jgi:predicted site-specific integrase-resolvase